MVFVFHLPGPRVKEINKLVMAKISVLVPITPCIGKADSMTPSEREQHLRLLWETTTDSNVDIYDYEEHDESPDGSPRFFDWVFDDEQADAPELSPSCDFSGMPTAVVADEKKGPCPAAPAAARASLLSNSSSEGSDMCFSEMSSASIGALLEVSMPGLESVVSGDAGIGAPGKLAHALRAPNIFALVCFDDVTNPSPSRKYLWGEVMMMNEAHGDFPALHRLLFNQNHLAEVQKIVDLKYGTYLKKRGADRRASANFVQIAGSIALIVLFATSLFF